MTNGLLDVGDELYTYGQWNSEMYYTGKIDRVTNTLAFIGPLKLHRKYRGSTDEPGDHGYHSKNYYLLDDKAKLELSSQVKRRKLVKPLMSLIDMGRQSIANLSDDQLERINAILSEGIKEPPK